MTGTALQYKGGTLSAAIDPVGSASCTGSAWPSFAVTYYNATGRYVCFVPTAVGGTSQTYQGDPGAGNWDDPSHGGTLYGTSVTQFNAALVALTAAGYVPKVCGVLWDQGETDATQINNAVITSAQYLAALQAMIARYRSTYGAAMPFYIFQTGWTSSNPVAGYQAVMADQELVAATDPYTFVVFYNAFDFVARGMMTGSPLEHYSQAGYNEMGCEGAQNVIAAISGTKFQKALGTDVLTYTLGSVRIGYPISQRGSALCEVIGGASVRSGQPGYFRATNFAGNSAFIGQRVNGTPQAPTGILSGDSLMAFFTSGLTNDNATWSNYSGYAGFYASENFVSSGGAPTATGTRFSISTTAIGAATRRVTFNVNDNGRFQSVLSVPPASVSDTGAAGEIAWDANHLYLCKSTNNWVYTPLVAVGATSLNMLAVASFWS